MQGETNGADPRVGQLEKAVERLTSEVLSLKLELATVTSAIRDGHLNQTTRRSPSPVVAPAAIEPRLRPSIAPAAIVVVLAVGLLAWQLVATPSPVPSIAQAGRAATQALAPVVRAEAPPAEAPPTEPPITPLVRPTIYKGTLSVNADHPGATVFINRKNVGTAPVRVRNLRAGAHLVWIERAGFRRWTRVITVPAERVTRVSADLEPAVEFED